MINKSQIDALKSKLSRKGISDPKNCTHSNLKELDTESLNQISGGFGKVISFTRSHSQGGVHTKSAFQ